MWRRKVKTKTHRHTAFSCPIRPNYNLHHMAIQFSNLPSLNLLCHNPDPTILTLLQSPTMEYLHAYTAMIIKPYIALYHCPNPPLK